MARLEQLLFRLLRLHPRLLRYAGHGGTATLSVSTVSATGASTLPIASSPVASSPVASFPVASSPVASAIPFASAADSSSVSATVSILTPSSKATLPSD